MNKKKHLQWLYVLIVVGTLAAGGVSVFALPQKTYSAAENRYLTKLPRITIDGILTGNVQRDLTEAASDQFPLRDQWMQVATTAQYLLYLRQINGVYVGKDGYLFEKVLDSDLSEKNYETNLLYVTAMKETTDADVSVMLLPSPGTVLKEKLPKRAVLYDAQNYEAKGAQICEAESVRFIQTRDELERAARESLDDIYFHTDHHWTTYGAYIGAKTYLGTQHITLPEQGAFDLQTASEDFYGTIYSKVAGLPLARADQFELPQALPEDLLIEADRAPADAVSVDGEKKMPELTGIYDLGKLEMKDKYAVYFGGNYGKLTVRNPQAEGKLLLIKDSFANSMVPYLLGAYGQITMIDLRYYNESVPELVAQGWDEVLFCYEMSNFIKDRNLLKLIR